MRARVLPLLGLSAGLLLAAPQAAPAASRTPVIKKIRCVPASAPSCTAGVNVTVGRRIQLSGRRLTAGMRVTFRWSKGALATKLRRDRAGYTARVPAGTSAGKVSVKVTDRGGRRSRGVTIRIGGAGPTPVLTAPVAGVPTAFSGPGMWIWELPKTENGNVQRIVDRAVKARFDTVFVKAADGGSVWRQFTPQLVQTLKDAGLHVCAWQYVYGRQPATEAKAAVTAIRRGADCFVVDAESQYEGRYQSAQTYMQALRAGVGPDYPVALTSFPYTDYHPRLPYSVFLGPGGAQVNAPQVYWKDIGGSVDAVSARTFAHNRIYGRPLAPLGQTYQNPGAQALQRFRQVWSAYGAGGLSWWDWQETSSSEFSTLGSVPPAPVTLNDPGWPALAKGAKGDQVLWLQQHLRSDDATVKVTGTYDAATVAGVKALQAAHGSPATGTMDAVTWPLALSEPVTSVDWSSRSAPRAAASPRADGARRSEIPSLGAGGQDG